MEFVMVITGTTQLLGVIGYPIKHSWSPVMHNAAIEHLGVDYAYVPLAIDPQHLSTAIDGLWAIGWQGLNVTIPHKQTIMAHLAEISPTAQAVGAVNTVWRTKTGWAGDNTDITGFVTPLRLHKKNWPNAVAIVLGGGGAARAVVAGLQQLGVGEIWVVGRDVNKLAQFQASWKNSPLTVDVRVCGWEQLEQLLPQANLVVNCTPIGMAPQQNSSPLSAAQITKLPPSAIVYDLIYSPRPTELLKMASEHGCDAIDGLEMLIYQGAAALKIWVGQEAPVDVMRQSILRHTGSA
jgi:shikimate dehydrogenase